MPGRKNINAKGGERLFDSRERRDLFLAHLRDGKGRHEAADILGVHYSTIWRYLQDYPDYLDQVRDAEAESVESVFKYLRDVVNDTEVPHRERLRAADTLAKYRARDQKNDSRVLHEHKHTLEIGGDSTDKILELQRQLADRRELPPADDEEILEAEVIEDDTEN